MIGVMRAARRLHVNEKILFFALCSMKGVTDFESAWFWYVRFLRDTYGIEHEAELLMARLDHAHCKTSA